MSTYNQVSENVFVIASSETRSNVSIIELKDFLISVDTGMYPKIAKEYREKIEKKTAKRFEKVIITHYHGDHVFGLVAFKDNEIISTQKTYELMMEKKKTDWTREKLSAYIKSDPEVKDKMEGLEIVLPSKTFWGEFEIKNGEETVKIVETGGHCEGSAFVYYPKDKVLITGDLFFEGMWPYGGDPTADPYKWIKALEEMLKLEIRVVVPGHGSITNRDGLVEFYEFMKNLVSMLEELAEKGADVEEAVEKAKTYSFGLEDDLSERFKDLTIRKFYQVISNKTL